MNKSKHTQGRWVISTQRNRVLSDENGPDYEIASCTGMDSGHPCPEEMQIANTRLIAAVPDLLEKFEKLIEQADQAAQFIPHILLTHAVHEAKQAIKKARGES